MIVCVGLLLLLGIVMLNSVLVHQAEPTRLYLHLKSIGLGLLLATATSLIPYQWWRKPIVLYPLVGSACLALVLVLVPGLGDVRNGARRWLWGGQPSECAKIALVLFLADYGARHQLRMNERSLGFIRPALLSMLMVGLVFLEPDWGTAALTALVAVTMLSVAGTSWFYLVASGLVAALMATLLVLADPLRFERIRAFTDLEVYQSGAGFQQWRSLLALGLGGIWGCFFGGGRFKAGYVPEQETDFIFSLIGEETGLAGGLCLLAIYMALLWLGGYLAWRVVDPFAQLVAMGITLLIEMQALINLGVVTGSLPNKGLPLPFVSYGGSNLICLLGAVGILVNIAWRAPRPPGDQPGA